MLGAEAPVRAVRGVALLTPGWPPRDFGNGVVTYTNHLRAGLEELGVKTVVIAGSIARDHDDPNVVSVEATRSLFDKLEARARSRFDPINARSIESGQLVASAFRACDRRRRLDILELEEAGGIPARIPPVHRPIVVRLHGPWFIVGEANGAERDELFQRRVEDERRGLTRATVVTAPSADVLARVRAYYGLDLPTARVIPNPVPQVPPCGRWVDEATEPETMLFVGRFDRVKGGDVVVRAFRRIAAARPRARLVFAGPDMRIVEDGVRIDLPTFLARELPREMRARVEVLGPVPADALGALRRRCAITLVPSRYETFGMTTLEALAHGCPVVASAAGGICEIVRDGENGLLVPPGDPEALAAAALRLLGDAALRRRIAAAGPADCAARFAPRSVARATLDTYRSIVSDR